MSTTVHISCSADTQIATANPDSNRGITPLISTRSSNRKILMRFILSSIPLGSICLSAALNLYQTESAPSTTSSLWHISDSNGDWVEGIGDNDVIVGAPCWSYKAYDTVSWAGSVGLAAAGTDFINQEMSSISLSGGSNGTLAQYSFNVFGLSVVQGWFGLPSNNGFLVLSSASAALNIHSRESLTPAYHPLLSITYDPSTASRNFFIVPRLNSLNQVSRLNL